MKLKTISVYAMAVRRMVGRGRPDPEIRFVVKALVFLTLTAAMSLTLALHRHDGMTFPYWLMTLFAASIAGYGWVRLVREILKELTSIASLIGAPK
jgi:hypothetical protein